MSLQIHKWGHLHRDLIRDRAVHQSHIVSTYDKFKKVIQKGGFARCGWDGSEKTEAIIKDQTKATIRCIPFDEHPDGLMCIFSGDPAKHEVIFAKAY